MLCYDAILPGPSTPEDPEEPLGIADAEFILQAGCPGNQQCVSSEALKQYSDLSQATLKQNITVDEAMTGKKLITFKLCDKKPLSNRIRYGNVTIPVILRKIVRIKI